MSVNRIEIDKSIRKIRKFLKKAPRNPASKAVHRTRTSLRRLETSLEGLGLDSNRSEKRLLKHLGRLRRRCGKVRDFDVLTGHVLELHAKDEQDCLVRLLDYLINKRVRRADKLHSAVTKFGERIRQDLKKRSKMMDRIFRRDDQDSEKPWSSNQPKAQATAELTAQLTGKIVQLWSGLNEPKTLDHRNLHPYRIKVKRLRYLLELSPDSKHLPFLEKLSQVKDAIGEWHDWEELIAIAEKVLDHGPHCDLLQTLKATSKIKYEEALVVTNQMRSAYVEPRSERTGRRRAKHAPRFGRTLSVTSSISA